MTRRTYTDAEKAEALRLYVEVGPNEAGRRTGIDPGGITRWAKAEGLATLTAKTETTLSELRARMELKKARLADGFLDDAEWLRQQIRQPSVEKVVKTVGTGKGMTVTEIVDVEFDEPTAATKKTLLTAAAIAVDKAQILTGGPTERTEHTFVEPLEALSAEFDEICRREAEAERQRAKLDG